MASFLYRVRCHGGVLERIMPGREGRESLGVVDTLYKRFKRVDLTSVSGVPETSSETCLRLADDESR